MENKPVSDVDELIQKYTSQPPPLAKATGLEASRDGAMAADIVKKYTEDSGTSLDEIIAKYSQRAEAINPGKMTGGLWRKFLSS